MYRISRSLRRSTLARSFNWDVVVRLALVPAVSYVLLGAALSGGRRGAGGAAMSAAGPLVQMLAGR